jgi:hypothetical protein
MSEIRDELNRNLQKQKTRVSMTDDELGAATAAQVLNTALLGYGDDVAGAIDYLDDVIRLGKTDSRYADKVAYAKRLRERLALNDPLRSTAASIAGGAAAGAGIGGALGEAIVGPGMGATAAGGSVMGGGGGALESVGRRIRSVQPRKKPKDYGLYELPEKKR